MTIYSEVMNNVSTTQEYRAEIQMMSQGLEIYNTGACIQSQIKTIWHEVSIVMISESCLQFICSDQ
jgi:hypothetical protein